MFVPILEPATGSCVAVIIYGTWANDWAPAAVESVGPGPRVSGKSVSPPASHMRQKLFSHSTLETEWVVEGFALMGGHFLNRRNI